MKTCFKLSAVLILCLMIVPLLFACGGAGDADAVDTTTALDTAPEVTVPAVPPLTLMTGARPLM